MNKEPFNIKFLVDDIFLAKFCIRNYQEERFNKKVQEYNKELIKHFQNTSKSLSQNYYNKICDNWYAARKDEKVSEYINAVINTDSFKKIREETTQTLSLLQLEWEANYSTTKKYLESLGIVINGDFTVYFNHPIFLEGQYWGNGIIIWSYRNDFPNYNVIYIWHEILHELIGKSEKEHALIELITDNEMRKRLNGTKYPPFTGHKDLQYLREKFNPKFQEFLKNPKGSVVSII